MNAPDQPLRKRPVCTLLAWALPGLFFTLGTILSDPDIAPLRKWDYHAGSEDGVSVFAICILAGSLLAVGLGVTAWRRGERGRGFALVPAIGGGLLFAYILLALLLLLRS